MPEDPDDLLGYVRLTVEEGDGGLDGFLFLFFTLSAEGRSASVGVYRELHGGHLAAGETGFARLLGVRAHPSIRKKQNTAARWRWRGTERSLETRSHLSKATRRYVYGKCSTCPVSHSTDEGALERAHRDAIT